MLEETGGTMKKAVGILADLSADDKKRMIAEAREKELRDQISREQGARKKGRADIIYTMLKNGVSIADVSKMTGLSEAEIEGLKS